MVVNLTLVCQVIFKLLGKLKDICGVCIDP